jgi:hypothetical protein
VSFGFSRFCGTLGFSLASIGTFWILRQWLGIDASVEAIGKLSGKGIVLFVASAGAGVLGAVIGQGVGGRRLFSPRSRRVIDTLWHFGVLNGITWSIQSYLLLTLIRGRDSAEALVRSVGIELFGVLLFLAGALIGCLLGLEVLTIDSYYIMLRSRFSVIRLEMTVTLLTGTVAGAIQGLLWRINPLWGCVLGVVVSFLTVRSAPYLIRKDELRSLAESQSLS